MTEKQKMFYEKLLREKNADEKMALDYMFSLDKGCFKKVPVVTELQFDGLLEKRLTEIDVVNRAIEKHAVTQESVKEIDPVILQGYEFDKDRFKATVLSKLGMDGRLRGSIYSVSCILFSSNQIFVYRVSFSLISQFKQESTEEYFYKDITNFSSEHSTVETIKTNIQTGCLSTKKIDERVTKDTSSFSIIVPGDRFYCSTTEVDNPEEIIRKMKMKLREKKA